MVGKHSMYSINPNRVCYFMHILYGLKNNVNYSMNGELFTHLMSQSGLLNCLEI